MNYNEKNISDYLNSYSGIEVDFLRFPGNYGDALIWAGTKQLLKESKIPYRIVHKQNTPKNEILIIDGGGNLVDYYSNASNYIQLNGMKYKHIIILPHTIFGTKAISALLSVEEKLTIFCREKSSYDLLKKYINKSDIFLWHDCAFQLEMDDIAKKTHERKGLFNAFRTDVESINDIPVNNRDISQEGNQESDVYQLLNTLSKYKEIHTDRLHIGIAGTLLGCKVTLYPNSYFKNKAVYDYSLKQYPNIEFI